MGPQRLKQALFERRDEGDEAALETTTEQIAGEFGPEEGAIQVSGNTSMCACTTAHTLRFPVVIPDIVWNTQGTLTRLMSA